MDFETREAIEARQRAREAELRRRLMDPGWKGKALRALVRLPPPLGVALYVLGIILATIATIVGPIVFLSVGLYFVCPLEVGSGQRFIHAVCAPFADAKRFGSSTTRLGLAVVIALVVAALVVAYVWFPLALTWLRGWLRRILERRRSP